MQYELYIDIFFLDNFIMDYCLLIILKHMTKHITTQKEMVLGAVIGAALSSLIICIDIPNWGRNLVLHFVVNVLMLYVGLRARTLAYLVKSFVLLYIVSFLFGGVISVLDTHFSKWYSIGRSFIVIAMISYVMVRKSIDWLESLFKVSEVYCDVTLHLGEVVCHVKALVDSGNNLVDNITGKPVHIISSKAMNKLINGNEIQKIRYIPYYTIQNRQDVLPVMRIDKMCIQNKECKEICSPLIGISSKDQFEGGTFDMIMHPKEY